MLPHKRNRNQKLMLKTVKTEQSSLANRMVQFCRDRRQSGAPSGFNKARLLWPSGIWLKEKQELRQLKELWQWLVDLNEGKQKMKKKLGQSYEKSKLY
jgi:hypothetical protein